MCENFSKTRCFLSRKRTFTRERSINASITRMIPCFVMKLARNAITTTKTIFATKTVGSIAAVGRPHSRSKSFRIFTRRTVLQGCSGAKQKRGLASTARNLLAEAAQRERVTDSDERHFQQAFSFFRSGTRRGPGANYLLQRGKSLLHC